MKKNVRAVIVSTTSPRLPGFQSDASPLATLTGCAKLRLSTIWRSATEQVRRAAPRNDARVPFWDSGFHTPFGFRNLTLGVVSLLFSGMGVQLTAFAQGTAFTYQGRLNTGGNPASGAYDFRFRLAADPLANNYIGSPFLTNGVVVNDGLFTAALDFGPGIFAGSNYWLEVDVRTNGGGSYTVLNPLQALTPTPYSVFADTAGNVSGTISSASLSGTYGSAVTLSNINNSFSGAFGGNGAGISNVNAATLNGLNSSSFWRITGNTATVAGSNYLGTADNQPLELRVNGMRAFRIEPKPDNAIHTNAVNVIGGSPVNFVSNGVYGATVFGGAANAYSGEAGSNSVVADFGTVAGGFNNTAAGNNATVGGGYQNFASGNINGGDSATVAGGWRNSALGNNATIAGGAQNLAAGDNAAVGGGSLNSVQLNGGFSTIAGGGGNKIAGVTGGNGYSTIGGGAFNNIQTNAAYNTIAGGTQNAIQTNTSYSIIGGGYQNAIQSGGSYNFIGGGSIHAIQTNVTYSTIAGGWFNIILANSSLATVGGGYNNSVAGNQSTIGGGDGNNVASYSSTIAGGERNTIAGFSPYGTIAGGGYNYSAAFYAAIGGGASNAVYGYAATVPGGTLNTAFGSSSFAAGHEAYAEHDGSFVWSDSQNGGGTFSSTSNNQFSVRASGGMRFVTSGAGMTLDGTEVITSGNVGIGATSPQAPLHISTSGEGIRVQGQSSGVNNLAYVSFYNGVGTALGYVGDGSGGDDNMYVTSYNGSVILYSPAGGAVFVSPVANVGIRRAAVLNALEVEGAASKTIAGSWLANSDARIKTGVQTISGALDKLSRVRLVQFRYTDEYRTAHPCIEDREYLNVIAQEFQKVFPEYVKRSGDKLANGDDILQVDTYPLTIYSAAAVQELNQKVEVNSQKNAARIQNLEAENALLKQRLDALEKIIRSLKTD